MCAVYKEECLGGNASDISGPETNRTFGCKEVMVASGLTYPANGVGYAEPKTNQSF